jgi:hypothetical protein
MSLGSLLTALMTESSVLPTTGDPFELDSTGPGRLDVGLRE